MTVYLVGAGPGDPRLITVRGEDLLRRADVIVYDRLAGDALLDLARPDCLLIDAGKQPGDVALTQDETTQTLIEHGRSGALVVRLKGGDPFVFGRGGEEAQALREAGVAYEIVPGVTSAISVPAYAGVPVTHRDLAAQVTIVTGARAARQAALRRGLGCARHAARHARRAHGRRRGSARWRRH